MFDVVWPEDEDLRQVKCVGFTDTMLPIIASAIDNGHVHWRWSDVVVNANGRTQTFDYLGFRYSLEAERVYRSEPTGELSSWFPVCVTKIAKLDVDDDGLTIVLEQYPLTGAAQPHQQRPEHWGTF